VAALHLSAAPGEIAGAVLLPGDPVRGEKIARSVLTDPHCHNALRNMSGYTGGWSGGRLSVQATGMGAPSMAIYATELFEHYQTRIAIRVGTCGALQERIRGGDLVIAVGAGSDSPLGVRLAHGAAYHPTAPLDLAAQAAAAAHRRGWTAHAGSVMSSDAFYGADLDLLAAVTEAGALAVDMETAALYAVAARYRVRALSILTVTDCLGSGESIPPEEREDAFTRSTSVALDVLRACEPEFGGAAGARGDL